MGEFGADAAGLECSRLAVQQVRLKLEGLHYLLSLTRRELALDEQVAMHPESHPRVAIAGFQVNVARPHQVGAPDDLQQYLGLLHVVPGRVWKEHLGRR